MSNLILDKENIKTQSVVDFEGIENITKFKFRNTKPKYPKPGTFYWIEEDVPMEDNGEINIEHKYGIYFVIRESSTGFFVKKSSYFFDE